MSKKLIIFGNGVGMALDAEKFDLKKVMPKVWEDFCCDEQASLERKLIASCLKDVEEDSGPTGEDQLMGAQLAQFGHEMICHAVDDDERGNWFTKEARDYPAAIAKYIYNVARKLDANSKEFQADHRFVKFTNGLIPFIAKTKSHVATLNYDALFYSAFNEEQEINGAKYQLCQGQDWKTHLSDGYRSVGFMEQHFEPPNDNDFGYYLHLHGSPLFVDRAEGPKKLNRSELGAHNPQSARHIILSDGNLKPLLIQRSEILTLYWKMLGKALDEAEEIILLGYGGADKHLNEMVKRRAKDKEKFLIEWSGTQHWSEGNEVLEPQEIDPKAAWKERLGAKTTVIQADDILEFSHWDDPQGFLSSTDIPF